MAFILSVLSLLLLKYAIDYSLEALTQVLQLIIYASLPIAGGFVTLSSCSLLRTFMDAKNLATFHLLTQTLEHPTINFSIGFLITAYLNIIRPPLVVSVPLLPYTEWITIALAVYVMYTRTKISGDDFYVSSEGLGWKKHTQQVRRETGHDLMRITSVMKQFVDRGVKEPLLVCLALHLQRLGEPEEYILKTLSPLADYQENESHFLAFPWVKRKLAMRNKKAREDILRTSLEKINRLRPE